jgi:hypothetical protein
LTKKKTCYRGEAADLIGLITKVRRFEGVGLLVESLTLQKEDDTLEHPLRFEVRALPEMKKMTVSGGLACLRFGPVIEKKRKKFGSVRQSPISR